MEPLRRFCGTVSYMAPEVQKGSYTSKVPLIIILTLVVVLLLLLYYCYYYHYYLLLLLFIVITIHYSSMVLHQCPYDHTSSPVV